VTATLQLNRPATPTHPGGERGPVRERLLAMLLLMGLLHAILILGLTFRGATAARHGDAPQFDVLLVTNEVPEAHDNERALYLAQRSQRGSGTSDAPLTPHSPSSRGDTRTRSGTGQDNGIEPSGPRPLQPMLSSSAASADIRYIGTAPASASTAGAELLGDAPGLPRSGRGDALELLLRGRSSKEQWITPDTQASKLAPYLAAWKRKVERVGTLNFPSAARSAGLSGSPVVEVEIGANGQLRQAHVRRSSGFGALDEAALTILRLASPFDPFPTDLAGQYSRLRFAYQWDFVAGSLQSGAVTLSSDTSTGP
jgi:protein TonB